MSLALVSVLVGQISTAASFQPRVQIAPTASLVRTAADASGRTVVVWIEPTNPSLGQSALRYRWIDAAGVPGPTATLDQGELTAEERGFSPFDVDVNGKGVAVVIWTTADNTKAARLRADGSVAGTVTLPGEPSCAHVDRRVKVDDAGGATLVWEATCKIATKRWLADGTLTPAQVVSKFAESPTGLAVNAQGSGYVTWVGDGTMIRAVTKAGKLGPVRRITSRLTGAAITVDRDRNVLAAYADYRGAWVRAMTAAGGFSAPALVSDPGPGPVWKPNDLHGHSWFDIRGGSSGAGLAYFSVIRDSTEEPLLLVVTVSRVGKVVKRLTIRHADSVNSRILAVGPAGGGVLVWDSGAEVRGRVVTTGGYFGPAITITQDQPPNSAWVRGYGLSVGGSPGHYVTSFITGDGLWSRVRS